MTEVVYIQGNTINHPSKKEIRLGEKRENNQGFEMEIVEYKSSRYIVVQFNDLLKTRIPSTYANFQKGSIVNPNYRIGLISKNKQGCTMKIIEYNSSRDLWIEFQDKYKYRTHCTWEAFSQGTPINPNFPTIYGVGIVGTKYKIMNNGEQIKEYNIWCGVLQRCFDKKTKEKYYSYKDVTCCEEWLYFPNFYEWLHNQTNFDKWYNGERWAVDKDILIKGNKVYSPDTCCLVPIYINSLFTKNNKIRGDLPIGVNKSKKARYGYSATIIYGKNGNKAQKTAYQYPTVKEAFLAHKKSKEAYIQRVAQEEYDNGNITKKCYDAMMKYEVEITD